MTEVSLIQLTKNAHSNFQKLFLETSQKSGEYGDKYGREDARREYFATGSQLNAWLLIQLEDFIGTINKNIGKVERYYNFSENDRKTFLANFDTINRASYLTKCMFDTQHFVKAISALYLLFSDLDFLKILSRNVSFVIVSSM